MVANRSAPAATVIPILVYEDAGTALEFLARAKAAGAVIVKEPQDMPFGVRQFTAKDVGGHWWTFSQNIRDVDPAAWGAKMCS